MKLAFLSEYYLLEKIFGDQPPLWGLFMSQISFITEQLLILPTNPIKSALSISIISTTLPASIVWGLFYLGVGLGATFGIEAKEINEFTRTIWRGDDGITDRFFVGPTAQLTLLGMRVGKTNAANIELGFGPEGILEVGYSYEF